VEETFKETFMPSIPRRLGRALTIAGVATGLLIAALAIAPSTSGQAADSAEPWRALSVLTGRGAEIGISVRDVEPADRQAPEQRSKSGSTAPAAGVVVEDVRPNSPAEKAGLKRSDLITEFDGERVRSARQFARLVQETAPGRTVETTIVRGGERKQLQIVPSDGSRAWRGEDRLRDRLGELNQYHFFRNLQPFDFNFDYGPLGTSGHGRLGITVQELTPQLSTYFGIKDGGVLVSSVVDDSPAARAGLKAGDVITSLNGQAVGSHDDLVRQLGGIREDEAVTIGIMRDRKEATVTVKLESRRPARPGRPV